MPENKKNAATILSADLVSMIEQETDRLGGSYSVNEKNYGRAAHLYELLRKFAWQNDGGISQKEIAKGSLGVAIVAEVPSVDLYRTSLEGFVEILGVVDAIDVSVSKSESLLVRVRVDHVWEVVSEK